MHYRVRGREIRTENTAKPASQASAEVQRIIGSLSINGVVCDLGCGKLRYSNQLSEKAERVFLVDSIEQLRRRQVIHGVTTTIEEFAASRMANASVMTIEEFMAVRDMFDFVFCSNVLSAIPSARVRSALLRAISLAIRDNGRALFITQYRNSYFSRVQQSPKAVPHLDGWLMDTRCGTVYYGILPPQKLSCLVARHGMEPRRVWSEGQMAVVLASRDNLRGLYDYRYLGRTHRIGLIRRVRDCLGV